MNKENVCKFNSISNGNDNISILNFVLEKNSPTTPTLTMKSVFRINIVTSGYGMYNSLTTNVEIKEGDIFITFPSSNYCVTATENFEYCYISFIGLKVHSLLERTHIDKQHFIKTDFNFLIPLFKSSISKVNELNIDLIAESLVLYTLGVFCENTKALEKEDNKDIILNIKKHIEDNFSDSRLNLKTLCENKFYNPKYISSSFKKVVGLNFNDYLTELRINHALKLIDMGFTSIKEISVLSGFADAAYFSKVFKKKTSFYPKEYIKLEQKRAIS